MAGMPINPRFRFPPEVIAEVEHRTNGNFNMWQHTQIVHEVIVEDIAALCDSVLADKILARYGLSGKRG